MAVKCSLLLHKITSAWKQCNRGNVLMCERMENIIYKGIV